MNVDTVAHNLILEEFDEKLSQRNPKMLRILSAARGVETFAKTHT